MTNPDLPAVDLEHLQTLDALSTPDAPDVVRELIDLFVADAPSRLTAIREAVAAGDLTTAAREAHALKGSAGNLGAHPLASRCADVERAAKDGRSTDLDVDAVADEYGRVAAALDAVRDTRP